MYNLYNAFTDVKISLAYFGIFSDEITNSLIDLSESCISKTEQLNKLSKKASFLIAESFQNVIRHGIIEKDKVEEIQYSKDFFQISILDDRIVISSANVIFDDHIHKLNENIELINSLDEKELKSLQKEVLEHGTMSEKGGASLGLIEMVRKSGLPLQKQFLPLKDGLSLVILVSEVPIDKTVKTHKVDIQTIKELYTYLVDKNMLMLYKGNFSNESNSSLIEMLNNNFLKDKKIAQDKIKNIVTIIEVMQNVSKHGKEINGYKEGIFSLSNYNGEFYIECSNFIKQESYEDLNIMLDKIKSSSMDEIEAMYMKKLAKSHLSSESKTGLGLLEVARFSNNSFTCTFEETPEKEIFYTIKIKTV